MSHKGHPYPAANAFLLDNPIRRWLQPASDLVEKLAMGQNDVVVDFGCGTGYYTCEIARRAKSTVAVDVSPEMLKKAKNKAARAGFNNIQFLLSDGKKIQLEDNSVDKILLVTVYHEIGESEAVLEEFSRILRKDGRLIIAEIVKKSHFPGAPVQNPEALRAEIEANGFKFQKMLPYKRFGMFFFTKTEVS